MKTVIPRDDKFPSPDQKSIHISTTPTIRGRKRKSPGSIPPRRVWKPQPHWVIADWLELIMEPARGESFPSGQRRGPAAPGEHRVSSPDQKSFHTSTTPTTRGRKRRSPGSIPLRTVWKPQPHLLIADWLGLMKPARGKRREWPNGTTSRFRRTRGAKFPIPGSEILPYLYYSNNLGAKTEIPESIPPRRV